MYILLLIVSILSLLASFKVKSTFKKYSKKVNNRNMQGVEVARTILDRNGLYDVAVEHVSGTLSDHYDPRKRVVRLSDSTYNSNSVAAVSVAAHECGHALQHHLEYSPLKFRSTLLPVANIGSNFGIPLVMLGLFFGFGNGLLVNIGIIFFSFAVLFQIVTLPVEFNASRRALSILDDYGILESKELRYGKKVLRAAALTYVATTAVAVIQLLRLVMIAKKND